MSSDEDLLSVKVSCGEVGVICNGKSGCASKCWCILMMECGLMSEVYLSKRSRSLKRMESKSDCGIDLCSVVNLKRSVPPKG